MTFVSVRARVSCDFVWVRALQYLKIQPGRDTYQGDMYTKESHAVGAGGRRKVLGSCSRTRIQDLSCITLKNAKENLISSSLSGRPSRFFLLAPYPSVFLHFLPLSSFLPFLLAFFFLARTLARTNVRTWTLYRRPARSLSADART